MASERQALLASVTLLGIVTSGLKDVQILVPSYIRQGEDVVFRCSYNLESDNLYAVKWYKDAEEFYRYVPKEVPPQQVFAVSRGSVDVDIWFSTNHDVLLRNVSLDQSGLFKCAVSAESTFQTLERSSNVTIVAIGYDPPRVQLDQTLYHPGDIVRANCTLPKTYPLPNLTWFINDSQIKGIKHEALYTLNLLPKRSLGTIIGTLNFTLVETFVPTSVSCRIIMFDLYDETGIKKIQPIPRNFLIKNNSGRGDANSSAVQVNVNDQNFAYFSNANWFLRRKGLTHLNFLQPIIVTMWIYIIVQ